MLPVLLIEQFHGERALITHLMQQLEQILQRRDAVAGIDPIRIRDGRLRQSWIVIQMEMVYSGFGQQLQSGQRRAALIKMIHVRQHTGFRMPALDGDQDRLPQSCQ